MSEHEQQIDAHEEETETKDHYVSLARNAHEQSESFIEAGQLARWRKNYALAQSQHPEGSKYHTDAYKKRSKAFRGKTESSIRKGEAALAVAMFSNRDVVSITPENQDDDNQVEGAKAIHRLTNYRLDGTIKWFMLAIGAYHETQIVGNILSEQYWEYKEKNGKTVIDKPVVELYPLENVKLSPHAHWLDPINSSPYVIIEIPMFIGDIKEMMEEGEWEPLEDGEIKRSSVKFKHNSVKQAREGEETTTARDSAVSAVTDFDIAYVHKNIIKEDGEDLFYYTLGTNHLLSIPIPLTEQYPHLEEGERPFTWGTATIEPHKVYHRSLTDRVAGTQAVSNELANLRLDNVKQALNKRKYVQRNMGVDYAALLRSVPGGTVLMDDIRAVKPEDTVDVTSSSYNEQHFLNADFDELAGSFSNGSVTTNRALNDTVGGMQMLKGDSNTLTEYQLRIFTETWIEPVVRQIVKMIQFYEDDSVIQQVTQSGITNENLQVQIDARVSVGFGSTDPQQKIEKLVYGLTALTKLIPSAASGLQAKEIADEIFGALGYNDGKKFMPEDEEDPRIQELMQQLQELQKIIETDQIKTEGQLKLEHMKGQNRLIETTLKTREESRLELTRMALDRGMKVQDVESRTGIESKRFNLDLMKELNRQMDIQNKRQELSFKERNPGAQGI